MNKRYTYFVGLLVLLMVLIWLDLSSGSTWLNIFHQEGIGRKILVDLRIPKTITAILAGMALSISGLMMQTLFRNPLAGPYILGVSSGASLGVALLTMLIGGAAIAGNWSIALSAILGAALVLMLVMAMARRIRGNVSLLIVGMMLGSIAGALVNLLQNFANPEALKLYIVWTLGSLGSVGWSEMQVLLPVLMVGFLLSVLLIKPLNGMMLGDDYAVGLGINVHQVRMLIVLTTGILAGGITGWCGPIAFVGVAVPHIARGIFRTADHRITLPACALIGANLLVLCDILSSLGNYPLPVSTVSALFGAPIIIWVMITHKS